MKYLKSVVLVSLKVLTAFLIDLVPVNFYHLLKEALVLLATSYSPLPPSLGIY